MSRPPLRASERPPSGVEPHVAADLERLRAEGDLEAIESMYRDLESARTRSERSVLARLRAAATGTRRAIAIAAFVAIAAFTFATTRRSDLSLYPIGRFVAECVLYATLLAASLSLALRPQHVPSLRRGTVLAFAAATLVVTVALALLPPAHSLPVTLVRPYRWDWASGLPCVAVGLLLGVPVYFVARVLDRGTPLSSVLAAAAAGLMGNLALELHCPSVSVAHRLVAHASIGFVFLLSLGVAYGLASLLSRRPP